MKAAKPERYREARYLEIPNATEGDFAGLLSQWLFYNRERLEVTGDGVEMLFHQITNVDRLCEHLAPLKKAIVGAIPKAVEACGVDDFDLVGVEMHATMHHHRSFSDWRGAGDGGPRRLRFAYYAHALPKMFSGGELEFLDGTQIEPENGKLVLFSEGQRHRVNPVTCWSHDLLHGRWALTGAIHGAT